MSGVGTFYRDGCEEIMSGDEDDVMTGEDGGDDRD